MESARNLNPSQEEEPFNDDVEDLYDIHIGCSDSETRAKLKLQRIEAGVEDATAKFTTVINGYKYIIVEEEDDEDELEDKLSDHSSSDSEEDDDDNDNNYYSEPESLPRSRSTPTITIPPSRLQQPLVSSSFQTAVRQRRLELTSWRYPIMGARRFRGYIPTLEQRRAVPGGVRRVQRRRQDLRKVILRREFLKRYIYYRIMKRRQEKLLERERSRKRWRMVRYFIRYHMLILVLYFAYGLGKEFLEFAAGFPAILSKVFISGRSFIPANSY